MYCCVNCGRSKEEHINGDVGSCSNYDPGGRIFPCKAGKCQYPINCTRRQECLSLSKEKSMSDYSKEISEEKISGIGVLSNEEIHHFASGASSSGHKPPYECLTLEFLKRASRRMQKGFHYGKHNWKKGAKDKAFILDRLNHAMEHLHKALCEIDTDTPMDDDDLAAVVVNCMMAMEYQKNLK